ncbi:cyclic nucleotide-binding/CBS domain-containing protein [Halorubrum sp. DTA98]|uniref:CBS domain-containing protein n=1 Tax=Halorubrum sp. DTA98 TaxID=3402163 RepID=UPI003AAEBDDE
MRTDTTANDVMHREFLGVSESDTLADAARLMVAEEADCLVVVRGGEPVGRLGSRDVLAAVLDDDAAEITVGAVMDPPLPQITPDAPLTAIEEQLISEGAGRVVVVADGEAVGVVTEHDALAAGATRNAGSRDPDVSVTAGVEPEHELDAESAVDAGMTRERDRAMTAEMTDASGSPTQGVCEVCGSLAPSLTTTNGQVVCSDCQQV